MIRQAGRFGFKVYYGDGTRLDVLRAAGTTKARLVAICVGPNPMSNTEPHASEKSSGSRSAGRARWASSASLTAATSGPSSMVTAASSCPLPVPTMSVRCQRS
jgi:hypothetical protein